MSETDAPGADHGMMEGAHPAAGMHASEPGRGSEDAGEPQSPAAEAFRDAATAMHEAMDIEFGDDADVDFARGMIGHHQGAIEMARVVLEHGSDPELKQLAENIIEAQEAEIAFLREWLAEHSAD